MCLHAYSIDCIKFRQRENYLHNRLNFDWTFYWHVCNGDTRLHYTMKFVFTRRVVAVGFYIE